jgi:hypothetical protein
MKNPLPKWALDFHNNWTSFWGAGQRLGRMSPEVVHTPPAGRSQARWVTRPSAGSKGIRGFGNRRNLENGGILPKRADSPPGAVTFHRRLRLERYAPLVSYLLIGPEGLSLPGRSVARALSRVDLRVPRLTCPNMLWTYDKTDPKSCSLERCIGKLDKH